jgi:hypothetical protein
MTTAYTLSFQNNSSNAATVCVYATAPDNGNSKMMSRAWLTQPANPMTLSNFNWNTDYSFVWSETGRLMPGVMFEPSQTSNVNPDGQNAVTLTYDNQGYNFSDTTSAFPGGSLIIQQSSTVPQNNASVGIAISGQPALAVEAQPNTNFTFIPYPNYWITFGNYESGEVLDVQGIPDPFEINYPANLYSAVVTLDMNYNWSVDYK